MFEDVFPVLLLMLLCVPVAIILIQSLFHETEVKELRQQVEMIDELLSTLLGIVEPRRLLEADLPQDVGARGGDSN